MFRGWRPEFVSVTVCGALWAIAAPTPRFPKDRLAADRLADGTIVSVVSANCRRSMLNSVSTPSLTFCGATGATVWLTVTLPFGVVVIV